MMFVIVERMVTVRTYRIEAEDEERAVAIQESGLIDPDDEEITECDLLSINKAEDVDGRSER